MVLAETAIVDVLTKGLVGQAIKSGWQGIANNELLQANVGDLWRDGKYLFFREYAQRYWNRHGQVRVLKMSRPMDLESIYINVKGLDQFRRQRYEDSRQLEQVYRESGKRRYHSPSEGAELGITFANREQYLMVFGEPGIGKSTFLRKVGLEAMKGEVGDYEHNLTPVFLELKNFTQESMEIADVLQMIQAEFAVCGYPSVEKAIPDLLNKGKLLILLDGLDEVPKTNLDNVVKTIQNFVDHYQQNRFIISCRTAARTTFRQFTDIEILEFDEEQIESFIYHWFSSELDQQQETAKQCWELLQQEDYKSARELAQTPLLLTFLCLVYDESQAFPPNRSRLYHDALRILLERWAAEKRLPNRRIIHENLNTEQEEILLSEIAYHNFKEDRLFFEKRDLTTQIKAYFVSNLNAPNYQSGEEILTTIEREQGIFVERAAGVYSFSHLTLQEYLTAQYIVDNENTVDEDGNPINLIEQTVKDYLTNPRWKEVFILMAGLIRGKADRLLLAMERQALDFFNTELGTKLIPILEWADRMTKDSVNSPVFPVGRRAIAYANAIAYAYANAYANAIAIAYAYANANAYAYAIANAIAYAYANANAIAYAIANANANAKVLESFNDLAELLMKDEIFEQIDWQPFRDWLTAEQAKTAADEDLSREQRLTQLEQLLAKWYAVLEIPPQLTSKSYLSLKDYEKIDETYFYAYRLLLDCKGAAPNLTPAVWEGIEDRMLKPPSH